VYASGDALQINGTCTMAVSDLRQKKAERQTLGKATQGKK
jgi:hypothetical protein